MNTSRNNTSRNNTSKSSRRRKAIPLYFQKSHSSLSDILQTASYKRRIKELLKNNKSLAVSLQDSKYKISNQQKEIEDYARTSTQISHAQLKLKDMASTIQKLVCDLDEVRNFLDINSSNLLKNTDSSDHRLRIQVPDHSTIEESASRSTLDLSGTEEAPDETLSALGAPPEVAVPGDDSMTEVYNLRTSLARRDSVVKGRGSLIKSRKDKNDKTETVNDGASITIQSPPTPQLEIPNNKLHIKLEPFIQNYTESPRKPLQALNSIPPEKNVAKALLSKIPKVSKKQPLRDQDENLPPPELPVSNTHRRETFVVKKPCGMPDICPADRRGTFTVSSFPQEDKCRNDRRGTYRVIPESVPPIQEQEEEPKSIDNFIEPVAVSESALPNKTILLCEDMELTEIIPSIPFVKNNAALPLAGGDSEFAQTAPVSELPSKTVQAQDTFIGKRRVVPERNESPVRNVPGDACFVKPHVPKSNNARLPGSSDPKAAPEPQQIPTSGSNAISEEHEAAPSRKSSAKRKKSDETDSSEKETLREKSSSMSKRKSIAPKKSGVFSDVKSKKTQRQSIARTSFKKPLSPMVSVTDDQLSDISARNSFSSGKRRARNKSSVSYEKFFDASFDAEPINDSFVPGRKVLDFFETRQSLLPNKRKFVFTNSTKTTALESTNSAQEKDTISSSSEMEKDVFEFSASEFEDNYSNSKPKKQRKTSKRRTSTSCSQAKKESLNKKLCSEKISEPKQSKLEAGTEIENDAAPKKLDGISKSKKPSLISTMFETTYEDSFVIGAQADENLQIKELVNSKGDQIFSKSSKSTRRTPSRHCKKPSHAEASSPPKENTSDVESSVVCNNPSPSELTSLLQNNDKVSPFRESPPITESDLSGRDASEGPFSRSSKVSESKGRTKRTFSGVSDRRSKKKSTLDPAEFLEEFDSETFSQGGPPKGTFLNDTFALECEMTEVYNFRDILHPEAHESSSNQKQVVVENKNSTKKNDSMQITKDGGAFSDVQTHALTVNKDKKPTKDSHKEKADLGKLKKNHENSTRGTQPIEDTRTSSLSSDKSNKTLKDNCPEQVIVPLASKNAKEALSDAETHAPILSKNKKPIKDSHEEKADLIKKNEGKSTKTTSHIEEELISAFTSDKTKKTLKENCRKQVVVPLATGSSKDVLSDAETHVPIASKGSKPLKGLHKEKVVLVKKDDENSTKATTNTKEALISNSDKTKKTLKDNSRDQVVVPLATGSSRDVLSDAETHVPIASKGMKPLKDSHKEKADVIKKDDENSTKATPLTDAAFTSASSSDKTQKTSKDSNRKLSVGEERTKHVEPAIKNVVRNTLAVDALCSTEKNTPYLLGKPHEKKDSNPQQEHASKENKHRENPPKKPKAVQTMKTKHHEGTLAPSQSITKSSSTTNKISIFDKADFKAAHLDDLASNDFVAPKPKKHYKDAPPAEKEMLQSKPKKSRPKKSDLENLKSKSKVPAAEAQGSSSKSMEGGDRDPGPLSGAFAAVGMDEIVPPADFIPIHRLNSSGSIDCLGTAESKDNERRPSRRAKPSQSYKEPRLNIKMRR